MQKYILNALLLKEWIKLRRLFWVPFVVLTLISFEIYITLKSITQVHGAPSLWSALIYKETIYFEKIKWVLIGGGAWFASLQFIPECYSRRLRLLFHLPISYKISIYTMIFTGIVLNLLLLLAATISLFIVFDKMGYPFVLSYAMVGTIFPWGVAGITTYCAISTIIAESSIVRKLVFAFMGCVYISLFITSYGFSSMSESLWIYVIISIPWIFAFESAANRTKEGKI